MMRDKNRLGRLPLQNYKDGFGKNLLVNRIPCILWKHRRKIY